MTAHFLPEGKESGHGKAERELIQGPADKHQTDPPAKRILILCSMSRICPTKGANHPCEVPVCGFYQRKAPPGPKQDPGNNLNRDA
jgi:hypothetical protein